MEFSQWLLVFAVLVLGLQAERAGQRNRTSSTSNAKKKKASDLTPAETWWRQDTDFFQPASLGSNNYDANYFSSGHGLVQTHPLGQGNGPLVGSSGGTSKRFFTPLGFDGPDFLGNPKLSTADECARACRDGDPPRTCYYRFVLENYNTLGAACQYCLPNTTQTQHCQCVTGDGIERGILTANRMIPGPSIQVCENDKVVVDVVNRMEGLETTIHWHGVWQKGSQYYDGVPYVTQCPISQGETFRYKYKAANAGTHFWHSHSGVQKIDGLYGSLIVRQTPNRDPNSHLYDYDLTSHVILISDWFHEDSQERFPGRLRKLPGQMADSLLINGKGVYRDANTGFTTNTPMEVFQVTPGRRYRFRMINSGSTVCPFQVTIQNHRMLVIASDGESVQPTPVDTIIFFTGERYDFVIEADQPVGAYWIQARGLGECGITRAQQLAVLRYARGPYTPLTAMPSYDFGLPQGVVLNPLDAICNTDRTDAICVSQLKNAEHVDPGVLQQHADVKIFLPFRFQFFQEDQLFRPHNYQRYLVAPTGDHVVSLIDEISYVSPPSPPISQLHDLSPTQFCNGDNRPANCEGGCECTHKVDIPLNSIVEVVLVDEVQQPNLSHPFHLHGYAFKVIGIGRSPDANVQKINLAHAIDLDRRGLLNRQFNLPPAKDTIAVPNNGYVVLRFRADNPGYWFFHCHFLFHIVIGMSLVVHVGEQADLPPVPHGFPTCGDFLPPI